MKNVHGGFQRLATRSTTRRGFTVVELLVSIAIIGVLSALLLAAVQRARAASRLVACENNLRQFALASLSAADVNEGISTGVRYYMNVYPYAEATAVAEAVEAFDGTAHEWDVPTPAWAVCPEDEYSERRWGLVTYLYSAGIPAAWQKKKGRGIVTRGERLLPLQEIQDGLSNTVLASERLVSPAFFIDRPHALVDSNFIRSHADRYHFWAPGGRYLFDDYPQFLDACDGLDPATADWYPIDRGSLLSRMFHQCSTAFNHVRPPNSTSCYNGDPSSGEQVNPSEMGSRPATSHHIGGVSVATCDGAVRFVSSMVDAGVWQAVGTIAGQEANTSL